MNSKPTIFMNTQPHKVAGIPSVVRNIVSSPLLQWYYNFITMDVENSSLKKTIRKTQYGTHIWRHMTKPIIQPHMTADELKIAAANIIQLYKHQLLATKSDLVIIHWSYIVPRCLLQAAKELQIPFIIYYHGVYQKEASFSSTQATRDIAFIIEKWFIDSQYYYIFPSQLTKNTIKSLYHFSPNDGQSVVIFNALASYFFSIPILPRPLSPRPKIWFCMSRSAIKNKDFVLWFIQENIKRGDPLDIHIVSRGKTLNELVSYKNHITLRDPMPHTQLSRFFQYIDILFAPSQFETYGNVAVESRALWTPCYLSNTMGAREVFTWIGLDDYSIDFTVRDFDYYHTLITTPQLNTTILKSISNKLQQLIATPVINQQRLSFINYVFNTTIS